MAQRATFYQRLRNQRRSDNFRDANARPVKRPTPKTPPEVTSAESIEFGADGTQRRVPTPRFPQNTNVGRRR